MSFENLAAVISGLERVNTITFDGVTARLDSVETKLDSVIAKEATAAGGGPVPAQGFLEPSPGPRGIVGGNTTSGQLPSNIPPRLETDRLQGSPGLFGDTYSPQQLNRAGRRFDPVGGGGNAFAAQLGDFATLIEFVFGPDNFFAHTIRSQIEYLTSGAKSPAEVRLFLEAAFTPFIAGIQAEIASPSSSSQMRGVAGDLLRLIAGGNVSGGASFQTLAVGPTPVRTPTTPTATTATTTAGIGGTVTGGLGASTGATAGGVTAGIAGAVTAITTSITHSQETVLEHLHRVQGDLRAQADATRVWYEEQGQRVENQYLRPMRAEIHAMPLLGATQVRDLSMALERFQLSGGLSARV